MKSTVWIGLAVLTVVAPASSQAQEVKRGLRFVPPVFPLPAVESVTLVRAGEPGPGRLEHKPVASVAGYDQTLAVPAEGTFDVWWEPKEGLAVPLLKGVRAEKQGVREVKLAERLGVVRVRGLDLPRAEFLALTDPNDPGPDEKGYRPVQVVKDYREEMVAPEGFYAVWMKPANGARAQRVERRVRVLAGKVLDLD